MLIAILLDIKQILVLITFILVVLLAFALIIYDASRSIEANDEHAKLNYEKGLNEVRGTKSELDLIIKLTTMGFKPGAIFHDLYIANSWDSYTQIDAVLPTKVGILVFEVKDYSGWLSGKLTDKYWKQTLPYGRKFDLYNPIKQNYTHVVNLKRKLFLPNNIPYFSIIVFYGECEFKSNLSLPENTFLIYAKDLHETVSKIIFDNPEVTYPDKQHIVNILGDSVDNGQDPKIVESHIRNVKMFAD